MMWTSTLTSLALFFTGMQDMLNVMRAEDTAKPPSLQHGMELALFSTSYSDKQSLQPSEQEPTA